MSAMASQITSLTIVYSAVYSGADKRKKTSKLRVSGLCEGNSPVTGEFPAQRASNAENCFHLMTWHHYIIFDLLLFLFLPRYAFIPTFFLTKSFHYISSCIYIHIYINVAPNFIDTVMSWYWNAFHIADALWGIPMVIAEFCSLKELIVFFIVFIRMTSHESRIVRLRPSVCLD